MNNQKYEKIGYNLGAINNKICFSKIYWIKINYTNVNTGSEYFLCILYRKSKKTVELLT